MNRLIAFVLWMIPIVFLVVDMGDQGLVGEGTFWFFLVVILLFVARSLGLTGRRDDQKEESSLIGSGEESVSRGRLQVLLFVLTLLTTTWIGAAHTGVNLAKDPFGFAAALPFSLALLAILIAHELGHYFAARQHGMRVTLPYFIPVPISLGTLGAFVGLKSRAPNRKALFDVAIAGPLAGLSAAILALWLGLQNSMLIEGTAPERFVRFIGTDVGSSMLLAAVSKLAIGSYLLEGHRLILHPLASAGWFGVVINAIQLLPIGSLDGGYITRSLFGAKRANVVSVIGLIAVFSLALFASSELLMWAFVIFFVASTGDILPTDELTPIGRGRIMLGYVALALLLVIILPVPGSFYPALRIHPYT